MPAAQRQLYEKAMASATGDGASGGDRHVTVRTKTKLTVNGKEYASLDELPADVRRLYDLATKTGSNRLALTASLGPGKMGWLVAGLVIGAGLVLFALGWMSRP